MKTRYRWTMQLGVLGLLLGGMLRGAGAQDSVPKAWAAQWIARADGPARDFDVVYFRKTVLLTTLPARLVVDVSADTRFELHVNGKRVGMGPALADVHHWRYETFDLAPYLHVGENTVAAIVWNFGTGAAIAQMSSQTAFLLSAEDAANSSFNTDNGWQVSQEPGRMLGETNVKGYFAAGPPEVMDGSRMIWDWDKAGGSGQWAAAKLLGHAAPRGARDSPTRWILERNDLPQMKYEAVSAGHVVRAEGLTSIAASGEPHVTIPANSQAVILLDRKELITAYPSLELEGGKGATVEVTYAEALYDEHGAKGNRNDIGDPRKVEGLRIVDRKEGERHIEGLRDHIVSDGERRSYRTLWWRTWRYLQVEVKTGDAPLTIDGLSAFYTAYPFSAVGRFASDDAELTRIWDVGWRTAQLCAHETYMDTPYWEQLQYVGDTRIQALISYGVTGDDRLARQAMRAYRDSLLTDGLTQSRYPSSLTQVIPPFSLLWVGMLHDFWMYRDDAGFVRSLLPGTRGVLDWFAARQRADGLMGRVEWWPFVDWSPPQFDGGVPPQMADGGSAVLTLQFVEALRYAAEMEDRFGEKDRAARYLELAKRASDSLMQLNWDEKAGLLADTPEKKGFSQQANSLAVWLDVIPKEKQRAVMEKVLAGGSALHMAEASYYFRFYVARAMVHAGLGDEYVAQLEPWRKMLALGLSTWAETPEPTRSDSHAWSAHPTLDLLGIVGGITPGAAGFERVRIAPHLGKLQHVSAAMPTPKGVVEVDYTKQGSGWVAVVILPDGLPGDLSWGGKVLPLHEGKQTVRLE